MRRAAEDCLGDGDLCGFDFDEIQEYAGTNLDAFDTAQLDQVQEELMVDKIVLLIESELKQGTQSWQDAIQSPYQRSREDFLVCQENCPIPMEWSEWSCHCIKPSQSGLSIF